jgi:regulator of sigma E protease
MPVELMTLAVSLPQIGTVLLTIFGIGLVIFVHELGHFLCAKKVGVRVEVFSLGFGPRLFGFTRGPTDYRISAVPVGGYVKMAGDLPGEGQGQSDELLSRSVGERTLIYSGGVIMNVLFALVAFPIIFFVGVPMVDPSVGAVTPGGPAWKAGLVEGDRILSINGRETQGFTDIILEVALGDADNTYLQVLRNGEVWRVKVTPEFSENVGTFAIQVGQPTNYEVLVESGSPAEQAGLKDGDRIVAVDGRPVKAVNLFPSESAGNGAVTYTVERDGSEPIDVTLHPDWVELDRPILGIQPAENLVGAVRHRQDESAAPLRVDDRLLVLNDSQVLSSGDLRRIVHSLDRDASCEATVERAGKVIELRIEPPYLESLAEDVALVPEQSDFDRSVQIRVMRESAAARAGLTDGMRILSVAGVPTRTWDAIVEHISDAGGEPVTLTVLDGQTPQEYRLAVGPASRPEYGFAVQTAYIERRYGVQKAFQAGMHASWNLTRQAYLTLRKMIARQVSAEKNLGGIVAISHVSYKFAERGLAKLFYFLALLSLNLAVINLLPIPVLDGGHIVFLLVEKIKGSPVNDRVMGYSQVIGLMLILSTLIFVTYNDIKRLLP